MYDFLRGPMMWISVIICITGLAVRIVQLIKLTGKAKPVYIAAVKKIGEKKSPPKISISSLQFIKSIFLKTNRTIFKAQPSLAVLSFVFHLCLFITPLFLLAHNIIFFESWGFDFFSFPESVSDVLTVVFIACGIVYFLRRMLVPEVRSVTGAGDYILLFITVAPFLTGFLAYHQFFNYKTVMILHVISGQLMIIAIGVTRLSHMVFFFFTRFLLGGEYGFNAGTRVWLR